MPTNTVRNVRRPRIIVDAGTGSDFVTQDANFLIAEMDLQGDGRVLYNIELPFADYSGLQTEWEAGTDPATVLDGAIDDKINGSTPVDPPSDPMPSGGGGVVMKDFTP